MPYLGISPAPYGSPETFEDVFTGPFSTPQNVFTLTKDVTGEADIIVSINGVIQHGGSYEISGTGNRTLSYNTVWKFPGGSVPAATSTSGAVDMLVYNVRSAATIDAIMVKDFKR